MVMVITVVALISCSVLPAFRQAPRKQGLHHAVEGGFIGRPTFDHTRRAISHHGAIIGAVMKRRAAST